MRFVTAIALVALSCSALCQIDFKCEATPLPNLMPKLSELTGLTLEVTPSTQSEVVAIQVTNVTAKALMDKIAAAVNATWIQSGDKIQLTRTAGQARQEVQDQRRRDTELIRQYIDQQVAFEKSKPPFSESVADELASKMARAIKSFDPENRGPGFYQQFNSLVSEVPANRVAGQLLAALDPADLASVPLDERVVWSSHPNRMQRKLSPKIGQVVDRLVRDINIWETAKEKKGVKPVTKGNVTYYFGGLQPSDAKIEKAPTKVLLAGRRNGSSLSFSLELILADDTGKVLQRSHIRLANPGLAQANPPASESLTITPPEGVSDLLQAFGPEGARPSPRLKEMLAKPQTVDPLALASSPWLTAISDGKGMDMVASIPDLMFFPRIQTSKPIPVETLLHQLSLQGLECKEEDGWLIFRSTSPSLDRQLRLDRRVLGQLVGFILSGKRYDLDTRAAFTARMPREALNGIPSTYVRLLSSETHNSYMDEDVLRLYGSLSSDQKKMATADGLPMQMVRRDQIPLLNRMVFHGGWSELQRRHDSGEFNMAEYEAFENGLAKEPTESLPNGIPLDAVLKLQITNEEAYETGRRFVNGEQWPGAVHSIDELAQAILQQRRPDLFPWLTPEDRQNTDELRSGRRTRIWTTLNLTPKLFKSGMLEDNDLAKDFIPFSKMPAEFQKRLAEEIDKLEKAYGAGDGG